MHGGDGSDDEGVGAPVVPVLGEVDDGVRGDEMEMVARVRRRGRPVATRKRGRSGGGRRWASVDDVHVVWLQEKIDGEVREVRTHEGKIWRDRGGARWSPLTEIELDTVAVVGSPAKKLHDLGA